MSLEEKIDDIKEVLYGIKPIVSRLDENLKSVEIRLSFIEKNNSRMDERVYNIEKRSERKPPHWRLNVRDTLEMIAALPIAAHLIPSAIMFIFALGAFVTSYFKLHNLHQ